MTNEVNKKSWSEFQNTGLLLIINQILHIFGWAIILEMDGDIVTNVYPIKVKYKGFSETSQQKAYKKIDQYMRNHYDEDIRSHYKESEGLDGL
jgi:hypothetical protein